MQAARDPAALPHLCTAARLPRGRQVKLVLLPCDSYGPDMTYWRGTLFLATEQSLADTTSPPTPPCMALLACPALPPAWKLAAGAICWCNLLCLALGTVPGPERSLILAA